MLPTLLMGALLLGVLFIVVATWLIASWRLKVPELEMVSVSDFPPDELERLRNLGARLGELGLSFVGMQRERRGAKFEVWQALFRSEGGERWVVLEAMRNEQPRAVIHSFFSNGRTVTTSNGEFADFNVTENWRLTEQNCDDLPGLLALHQKRALGAGSTPAEVLTEEQFREYYLRMVQGEYEHLADTGFLKPDPGGLNCFRVCPWKSPRIALRMIMHSRRYKWAEHGRKRSEAYQAELDGKKAEQARYADVGEYKYLEYYKRDREKGTSLSLLAWTVRGVILFASILALLGISLMGGKIEPTDAYVIVGVLVVHELGHAIAMALFRYRDASVFFLPLIGCLARSRKVRVPSWQEFVVLLMGPLPGLLVGWGILLWAFFHPETPELWQKIGFWAALINNLNFLAVLPYDGGRIINLLVFERVPAIRVIYLLLSGSAVMVAVAMAFFAIGPLALALLWPLVLLGLSAFTALPDNLRLARMAPWARHNLSSEDDETDALVKAFVIVEKTDSVKGLERRGWTDFVDAVVKYGCAKKLGLLGTIGAMAVFLGCLYMPMWVFFGVAMGEGARVQQEQRELQTRIDDLAPRVSWSGAVVSQKTRDVLTTLQDSYEVGLEAFYSEGLSLDDAEVAYDSRGIFDPSEAMGLIKNLRWDEVSSWIAEEDTEARQETAEVLIKALMGDAQAKLGMGGANAAMASYSMAYWAVSTCEPKTSLAEWIDWLYLEHELLAEIEWVMGEKGVSARYCRWFAKTLRNRPPFNGPRMAFLLMQDLQGVGGGAPMPMPAEALEHLTMSTFMEEAGYPLRRCRADRDFREEREDDDQAWSLSTVIGTTRVIQGLPTRDEFRAGMLVAASWEEIEGLNDEVIASLPTAEQRTVWKARIDRVRTMQHYRRLAIAAFELGSARQQTAVSSQGAGRWGLAENAKIVQTPDGRFAVTTLAPDGTVQIWSLSPNFRMN